MPSHQQSSEMHFNGWCEVTHFKLSVIMCYMLALGVNSSKQLS